LSLYPGFWIPRYVKGSTGKLIRLVHSGLLAKTSFLKLYNEYPNPIDLSGMTETEKREYTDMVFSFPEHFVITGQRMRLGPRDKPNLLKKFPKRPEIALPESEEHESPTLHSDSPRSSSTPSPSTSTSPVKTSKGPLQITLQYQNKKKQVLITDTNYSFGQLLKDFYPKAAREGTLECQSVDGKKWMQTGSVFKSFQFDEDPVHLVRFVESDW